MHLQQIRYFVAVADSGGFTRGAQTAFVTQSTLSSAIARLEDSLGVPLFERNARGVQLTAAGQRFLPRARCILREMALARIELRRDAAPAPCLQIGLAGSVPLGRVAPLLARLPNGQRWRLVEAGPPEIATQLAAGRLDLAFNVGQPGRPDAGLQRRLLFSDRLRLAVPLSSPLDRGQPLRPEALDGQALIVRTHCELLRPARRLFEQCGVRPLIIHRTRSDERALALLAQGLGACLLPDSFALQEARYLDLEGLDLRRQIQIEWPTDARDPAVAEALQRWLPCGSPLANETCAALARNEAAARPAQTGALADAQGVH